MIKNYILTMAAALAFTGGLQASNTAQFIYNSNYQYYTSADRKTSFYVSPYSGTLDNVPGQVKLYCDDEAHNVYLYGDTWTVNESSILSPTATRWANQTNAGLPTGSSLYQELAWLFTQEDASGSIKNAAIQEAAWQLTAGGGPTSTKSSGSATSNNEDYWTAQAANAKNANFSLTGFNTVDFSNWLIVSDTKTGASSKQEFLAYLGPGSHVNPTATPEPNTLLMLGTGLMVGACLARRRIQGVRAPSKPSR